LTLLTKPIGSLAQGPTFYGIDLNYDITYYGIQTPYPSVTCGLYVVQSWVEYDQTKYNGYTHPSPYWHSTDWWLNNRWNYWELRNIGGRSDEVPLSYNPAYPNASLWKMNVSYDFGGDPLALAWIMFGNAPGWYNDFIYDTAEKGTKGVAAAVAYYHEPAAVAVYNGTHLVLFKGVNAYSDPSTDPNVQIDKVLYYDSLDWYWGPDYTRPEQKVPSNTWKNLIWGIYGYNYSYETGGPDPDPSVGGYRSYNHANGSRVPSRYFWSGKYVTVQWEDTSWVNRRRNPDWAYKGSQFQGQVIPWFDYSIYLPSIQKNQDG